MTVAPRPARPGKTLVLFVLSLTALLGMAAVVIDGGMMRTSYRRVQNVADSAALAAAMDLMRGESFETAQGTAVAFVQTHNGMADATVTARRPVDPPYAGDSRYIEVIVTRPSTAVFVAAAGMGSNDQQVSARAVAGFESVPAAEGVIALDPRAAFAPGLSVEGATRLRANGSVVVNNPANGWDQYGAAVPPGGSPSGMPALKTADAPVMDPRQAPLQARAVKVAGGVNTPANIKNVNDPLSGTNPLAASMPVGPDPLRLLPVPNDSNSPSITNWTTRRGSVQVDADDDPVTLEPGIYDDIRITGGTVTLVPGIYSHIEITGGTVTFRPGVYIISPSDTNQGLHISGGTVTGIEVMFYLTGSNYLDGGAGYWDSLDGAYDGPLPPTGGTLPADTYPGMVHYASLSISGGTANITLQGREFDPTNPSDPILFYQRRRNDREATISGGGAGNPMFNFRGTIYAKWAKYTLSGGGTYDAQFIVGRMALSGGDTMTINGTGINRGRAYQVYLVE